VERQARFSREVAEAIGYDFKAGRLDVSTHPFTEGLAPGDTRITSRFQEAPFADGLGSTMHEAGHALYEQGLPKDRYHGRPLSEAVSLGIHESQSRLWENQVGRSRSFWNWALPRACSTLGLDGPDLEQLYRAMNIVTPSLIRVEADEATYNLHIMLRFDLERAMLHGDLATTDLPAAWNDRIRADLGLAVPDDARGCLQDIHWSMGAIGYFPTYTLGNLYSAQIWEAVRKDLPDLDQQIGSGEFQPLLAWLREKIHRHGRRWPAEELGERVTGNRLSHEPLMRYLRGKLRPVYGLSGA
jgi:carboxypeptidase Taq